MREGLLHAYWPATFPSGEGSDLAGIVTKLGPGVTSVKVGDEVIGFTDRRASHAEYAVVEAQSDPEAEERVLGGRRFVGRRRLDGLRLRARSVAQNRGHGRGVAPPAASDRSPCSWRDEPGRL